MVAEESRREARRRSRHPGLDQPYLPRRRVPVRPDWDPDTFGRFSERIARFIGSWKFIAYMTAFIIVWFGWNTLGPQSLRFDPYAFLFMTLLLSLQASYAAPLILLAQNRQADRDRVQYEQDRTRDERSVADTEYLVREVADLRIALGEVATRDFVRSELRDLLEEIAVQIERPGPAGERPSSGPSAGPDVAT
jgi:uncharacterized membrane protein